VVRFNSRYQSPVSSENLTSYELGLKAQHAAAIRYLAEATSARISPCIVGSKTVEFQAMRPPSQLINRNIEIAAESASSILLVFQSVLPVLLFAGDAKGTPVTLTIRGGTNGRFTLSYEYLDQVLLPSLERFGVYVERKLEHRGWALGPCQIGSVKFRFTPLPPGKRLKTPEWPTEQGAVTKIEISILAPPSIQQPLQECLVFETDLVFPSIKINFVLVQNSDHDSRIYVLLVAHTSTGLRFGCDWLYDKTTRNKTPDSLATEIAQYVVDQLDAQIRKGGVVDEHLQDQLIIFQALAEGNSSIPGSRRSIDSHTPRVDRTDRTDQPFGEGSLHTTTARWVASQLLPETKWTDNGRTCNGVGWATPVPTVKPVDSSILPLDQLSAALPPPETNK